ncbi:hypothetical protein F2P81_026025 [Scophthalmus maximus]|nr:hypothetical protein F2P81_026025 [Scophthalmus maximus]
MDCFDQSQVKCDLTRFEYDKDCGDARMVYFRRSGKALDGKRGNLLAVVALRKDQDKQRELNVSTTTRFYRALKRRSVKGNGELMSCWNETLQELNRDTFISGQEMCQEIQQSAVTAFTRRVNPSGWCNSLPRHVESKIGDPVMIEVMELAIALMDVRIPSAFAVAELLYCPIERVRSYFRFQNKCASDPGFHTVAQRKLAGLMVDQMRKDRVSLADLVALYGENKKGSSDETARRCAEMLRREPPEDINKIQKTWYTLVKQDSAKDKDVYANVKVLFLKLRNNNNKLKKLQRAGEQQRDEGSRSCGSTEADEATGSRKETRLRHNREPRRGDGELDRDIEQERDRDSDENEGDHVDADKTRGLERGKHVGASDKQPNLPTSLGALCL